MKQTKAQKYRDMSTDELQKELTDIQAKLFGMKCQRVVGGGTSDFSKIKDFRRNIARIQTILNENKRKVS